MKLMLKVTFGGQSCLLTERDINVVVSSQLLLVACTWFAFMPVMNKGKYVHDLKIACVCK